MTIKTWICALAALALFTAEPAVAACTNVGAGLGVSRVIEIDASSGPLFGDLTKQVKEESFLRPKEVVLTFDDGPMPWVTMAILDALDRHCSKATFFSVGRMAIAYPRTIRDVLARGHTLGSHTWSHPLHLPRMRPEAAREEVERGFAAVALAANQPIAPFFRFPGLSDSRELLAHLQTRGVASFSVDVVSNDSFVGDTGRLIDRTLRQVEARQGGIILFHDIKAVTARALPTILSELKSRGYKVVHLKSKHPFVPDESYRKGLEPLLAKANGGKTLVPFFAAMPVAAEPAGGEFQVTELAPEPKSYVAAGGDAKPAEPRPRKPRQRSEKPPPAATSGWATTVRRPHRTSVFE